MNTLRHQLTHYRVGGVSNFGSIRKKRRRGRRSVAVSAWAWAMLATVEKTGGIGGFPAAAACDDGSMGDS